MSGIAAAVCTSIVCFLIHLMIISTGMIKINPEWCIKKLKHHAQLLLVIWIMCLPLFLKLDSVFKYSFGEIIPEGNIFYLSYGILFFLMAFFIYLTFYYVVDRSVSTRLMIEIDNSQEKKLGFEEIMKVYNLDTKYINELQGMIDGGFVEKKGQYYSNTLKGTLVAKCTAFYKHLFRLGKGG